MNNKKISMVVNKEDIRKLIGNVLHHILNRHNTKLSECIQQAEDVINTGTKQQIIEVVKEFINIFGNTANDLDNTAPLILEIEENISQDEE